MFFLFISNEPSIEQIVLWNFFLLFFVSDQKIFSSFETENTPFDEKKFDKKQKILDK